MSPTVESTVADRTHDAAPLLAAHLVAEVDTIADLARLLRDLRRRKAREQSDTPLTYRELAARSGWSRGIIGEYFAGRILPPTDRFDALIRLLGATPIEQGWLATARDRVEEGRRTASRSGSGSRGCGGPRQLPAGVVGFAGRAAELARLDHLLSGPPGHPVAAAVVTGTAGVGKTTLALHWAHRSADRFPDGQLYANLRGFSPTGSPADPAEAVRSFLDALGVPPQRIPTSLDAQAALFRGLLTDRRVLLVLDDARDADQVRPLLPAAPACRVLITSRDPLAGLVTTRGAHPVVLDLLSVAEAGELLGARIGPQRLAAEPGATDAIIAACARLPLALAVAATQAVLRPHFPLAVLAGGLQRERGLGAFTGDDPATDARAVFSCSYRALSPGAARLFRLIALHPGPELTRPAAASLACLPPVAADRLLTELTNANLLVERAPGRHGCHDLLRAYAAELDAAVDSAEQSRAAVHRLLDHCLHSAHHADLRLDPHRDPIPLPPAQNGVSVHRVDDHGAALAWFDTELPMLLAVARQAADQRWDVHLSRLARTMAHFLERRGHWYQWIEVQRAALAAGRRLDDPVEQAHAHRGLGRAHVHLDRPGPAREHLAAALELYRTADDRAGQGRIHFDLSWLAIRQDRLADALDHSRQALRLFTDAGHVSGQGRAHNNLGWCLSRLGRHVEAVSHCRQALVLLEELDDRFGAADAWDSLGYAEHQLGHHHRAAASYRHSYRLWRELGHRYSEADLLTRLGETRLAVGDHDGARDSWRQALDILDQLDHPDAKLVRNRLDELGPAGEPDRTRSTPGH